MPTIRASTPKWPSVSTSLRPTTSWSRGSGPGPCLPFSSTFAGGRRVVDLLGRRSRRASSPIGVVATSPSRPRDLLGGLGTGRRPPRHGLGCSVVELRIEAPRSTASARRSSRRPPRRPARRSARARPRRGRSPSPRSAPAPVSKRVRSCHGRRGPGDGPRDLLAALARPAQRRPGREEGRDRGPGQQQARRRRSAATAMMWAPTRWKRVLVAQ